MSSFLMRLLDAVPGFVDLDAVGELAFLNPDVALDGGHEDLIVPDQFQGTRGSAPECEILSDRIPKIR
jgi:hypothetical protein